LQLEGADVESEAAKMAADARSAAVLTAALSPRSIPVAAGYGR